MSLYADYIREKTNDHILETADGFATYRFPDENTVYIVDIYVPKEIRKSGVATCLANEIVNLAKLKGCTKLIGSVVPSAKDSDTSLKVLQGYGMTLDSSTNDFILFKKEI